MKFTKLLTSFIALSTLMLTGCDKNKDSDPGEKDPPTPGHTHVWSDAWSSNGEYHWHTCTGCEEVKDKAAHGLDLVGYCSVCHRFCGEELLFHQKYEFEDLPKNEKHYYRFHLDSLLRLKRDYDGFASADISIYRVNDDDEYEAVENITKLGYNAPAQSKTGYYYVVIDPQAIVPSCSFCILDDHTQTGNELSLLGYCKHSHEYCGIEVKEYGTTNYYFGEFVGQFEAYFRFLPVEGLAYYLELKNQLSHDLASLETFANVNGEATGLVPIDYDDPGYSHEYSAEDYYAVVTQLNSDGYVYVHWVEYGTTDEEFTAEDYFKVMAVPVA